MSTTDETTHTEVVRALPPQAVGLLEMSADEFMRFKGIATALAQSDAFGIDHAPTVFAKMVVGRELGLGVAQSMMGLHLVEKSVMMHYSTMLSCVRAHGWKYRIPEHTDEKCVIEWIDPDGELVGRTEFTMADAERAGIFTVNSAGKRVTSRGKESMYDKVPKNMLLARAVSNGVKAYVPEALGGMPVYVTGEIQAERYVDGSAEDIQADEVTVSGVAEDFPEGALRERFYAAYGEACEYLPGRYTPAAIQMSVRGQPQGRVEEYLDRMEAEVARARQDREAEAPPDAEVVGPDVPIDTEGLPDVPAEDLGGGRAAVSAPTPPAQTTRDGAPAQAVPEGLRRQLSDLLDRQAALEADPDADPAKMEQLDAEIRQVEEQLRELGGTVPGQEALDV